MNESIHAYLITKPAAVGYNWFVSRREEGAIDVRGV